MRVPCPVLLTAALALAAATFGTAETPPPDSPRTVLVLSGGGARGAAHIGVLKVLEELHVVPDLVVGTSMGSIVGGLYAAGWTPEEIEDLLVSMDWDDVLFDRIDRDERTFRRKQDDVIFQVPGRLRFRGMKPVLPSGALGGQKLALFLRSLEIQSTGAKDFDELPIPYRAVGADLATGEAVVIDHGHLSTAMRASMSIGGAFPPVEYEGHQLIDGGAAANLPVRIAIAMGAQRIIAIDISTPLNRPEEGTGFLKIANRLSSFLTVGNRAIDVAALRPQDILIVPPLGDISFSDFQRSTEAVGIGERAAREKLEALKAYSASDDEWQAFVGRHTRRPVEELRIDSFRLENTSGVDDRLILRQLDIPTGQPFDDAKVNRTLRHLASLDYFGVIRDELEVKDGKGELVIKTPPNEHGRASLQFGISFTNDFRGDLGHSIGVRHLLKEVNRRGAEWENVVQSGDVAVLSSAFYQPLDWGMRTFIQPRISHRRTQQDIWVDGVAVTEYDLTRDEIRLEGGRVFGNWGELRLGAYSARDKGDMRIGLPIFPNVETDDGGLDATFRVDTLDNVVFPTRGTWVLARYSQSLSDLGADIELRRAAVQVGHSFSLGRSTLRPSIEVARNFDEGANLFHVHWLGGMFRLSGLGRDELWGDKLVLARCAYYFKLVGLDLGSLSTRVFAGASLEAGNTYQWDDPVTLDSLRTGGALFVGAHTAIGPIYLAYGYTEPGRNRVYLSVGQVF